MGIRFQFYEIRKFLDLLHNGNIRTTTELCT